MSLQVTPTPDATALNVVTRAAQVALVGSGGALLVLGLVIWTGQADGLIPLHTLIGVVLVLSLWTIAATAARAGVNRWLIATAVAWSVLAPTLGTTQEALLEGDWHWTIQVLHLLVGMAVVAWGQALVLLMGRPSRG